MKQSSKPSKWEWIVSGTVILVPVTVAVLILTGGARSGWIFVPILLAVIGGIGAIFAIGAAIVRSKGSSRDQND